ncbi:hypothetical protein R3P38DRAFT_2500851 [Favolaschia claudopus]|uniref:C2H2-type domain-containing protein n=1 Tax=Favolaschia claudopus TaxID=2862362 RepID=A0AAW0DRU0_9AGAR
MAALPFPCASNCPRSFSSARELHIHQDACDLYKNAQALQDRLAILSEDPLELRKRKRRRRDPSTAQMSAGPSAPPNFEPQDVEMAPPSPPPPIPSPPPPPTPPPEVSASGRPVRTRRKTWKLLQQLPEPVPEPVVASPPPEPESPGSPSPPAWAWESIRTKINSFGLFREYASTPTYNPDELLTLDELADIPGGARANTATVPSNLTPFEPETDNTPSPSSTPPETINPIAPFRNWSISALMNWQWTGSTTKSVTEFERIVDVMKNPEFSKEDIMDFDVKRETAQFDAHLEAGTSTVRDGWRTASVDIQVPDGQKHASDADIAVFSVPGLFYRPIVEVIKAAIRDVGDRCFHYTPFKHFWQPTRDGPPQRVYDEIYSSEAMVEAHTALQNQPREPGCTLERVVLALMWWSDSTHLASFGDAALWPLYLFFGNQSSWLRLKPRSNLCHHLPDNFHDFFKDLTGHAPSGDVLTHCRRELMHAIWRLLLDDEFLAAYEHGIVIECQDGVFRRFYPRIFTYSADYPEKVLLATIRNLGKAPCPRCYIKKEDIPDLGTVRDENKRKNLARTDEHMHNGVLTRIRNWIYRAGRSVKSKTFDFWLLAHSWTPTSNAFSDRLSKFGFDPFKMLVPDFMHEFELGVFKAWFMHLLRILHAHGDNAIQNLNQRFRWVPTFGRSTVRRFTQNTSGLKKMAAWNYQCILVCLLPVVEGLLPDAHNDEILDVVFSLAEWHTLGKLKMHTDTSLGWLRTATKELGRMLRRFQRVVCPYYDTRELPSEQAARGRRQAKKASQGKGKAPMVVRTSAKKKEYSMETYKMHGLGDYVPAIPWVGTTNSWSTQPGELEHRRVKAYYARTNKNQADDPATKASDFLPKLQEHLLSRLDHPDWTGDGNEFTSAQRYRLQFKNNRIYMHKILRVNYTTYDVRLGQDILNPRTHSDVMSLPPDDNSSHPFSYAQVLGIFHADVVNTAPESKTKTLQPMDFLWVRRYRLDSSWRAGFKRKRLCRLEFLPESDPQAFGFLNPDEVIRGSHLIPAFAHGRTEHLLTSDSIGRLPREGLTEDEDWRYYYVNFFVDRDMCMRYKGGGVGHYRVEIPEEEDVPSAERDDNDDERDDNGAETQASASAPASTTPLPNPVSLARPDSPSSTNSSSSNPSRAGSDKADSEEDSEEDPEPEEDDLQSGDEDEEDFGPEDGDGDFEDEVEEGYAPL